MTDTHAPPTGPLPYPDAEPMFTTGALPAGPPNTEPHPSPIFDTGPHPDPLRSLDDAPDPPVPDGPSPQAFSETDNVDTDAFLRSVTGYLPGYPSLPPPAQPVAVPGSYQYVKRWKFALILAGVWLVSAAAGLGFYYWWYTSLNKTVAVLGILIYLVVCMVASLLVSMVPNRPQVTALAIALMAAPLAATAAAAVLHGAYYFEWIVRPSIR